MMLETEQKKDLREAELRFIDAVFKRYLEGQIPEDVFNKFLEHMRLVKPTNQRNANVE